MRGRVYQKFLGGLLKFFSPSQQYYYSISFEFCQEFLIKLKKFFELLLSLNAGGHIELRLMKSKNRSGLSLPARSTILPFFCFRFLLLL